MAAPRLAILTVFSLLLLALPASAQEGQVEPRAAALVDRWTEAMGTYDWSKVRDLRYTVTTVWYDTASGQETRRRPRYVWVKRDGGGWKVRVERREAEGHYVQTWDGQQAWATLNGGLLPDTAFAVREVEYVAGDLTYWLGLPWKLRDPGVNLRHLNSEPNGEGEVVAVTLGDDIGLHPRDRFWYYFGDASSPYPTEVHYIEQDKTARDRARLKEWVTTGPFSFARWRIYRNERGQVNKAILYSDVAPDRGVPSRLFKRPRG